jgi:hypothetical protein
MSAAYQYSESTLSQTHCSLSIINLNCTGVRARKIAEVNYRTEKVIERGRAAMKEKKKFFKKKVVNEDGEEVGM